MRTVQNERRYFLLKFRIYFYNGLHGLYGFFVARGDDDRMQNNPNGRSRRGSKIRIIRAIRCGKTLHFQQRIKRIILIYHAARRCIFLMPQAATNGIEWLHSAFVFIRCTLGCIVYCINSSYSKYSLWKNTSEPLARRSQFFMNLIICSFRRIHVKVKVRVRV